MAPIWLTLEVRPHIAKYIYLVGFAITAVASWLLRDYSQQALQHIPELRKCNSPDGTYENSCAGKGAVLRVSFGNFLFFCLHFILLIGVRRTTQARRLIHTGTFLPTNLHMVMQPCRACSACIAFSCMTVYGNPCLSCSCTGSLHIYTNKFRLALQHALQHICIGDQGMCNKVRKSHESCLS